MHSGGFLFFSRPAVGVIPEATEENERALNKTSDLKSIRTSREGVKGIEYGEYH